MCILHVQSQQKGREMRPRFSYTIRCKKEIPAETIFKMLFSTGGESSLSVCVRTAVSYGCNFWERKVRGQGKGTTYIASHKRPLELSVIFSPIVVVAAVDEEYGLLVLNDVRHRDGHVVPPDGTVRGGFCQTQSTISFRNLFALSAWAVCSMN